MILSERFKKNSSIEQCNIKNEKQLQEIDIVKKKVLTSSSLELHDTECPCGIKDDYGVIATTERYGIALNTVICNSCGTLRFKEYLTDSSLSEFYIVHYQKMYGRLSNIPKYFKRQKTYGRRIFETYKSILSKSDNILEIGCGAGGALDYFKQHGLNSFGCEYSQTLVEYAHSQELTSIYQGSLFDVQTSLPENTKFKIIYIHHVFEHVNNPLELLEKCTTLLKPDGKLIIGVPDFLKIDQFANPGCNLMPFLHIAHKYNFTNTCFQSLAKQLRLGYKKIHLHKDFSTPWSIQPELWGEFSIANNPTNPTPSNGGVGDSIFRYLSKTENDFKKGECTPSEKNNSENLINKLIRFFKP